MGTGRHFVYWREAEAAPPAEKGSAPTGAGFHFSVREGRGRDGVKAESALDR